MNQYPFDPINPFADSYDPPVNQPPQPAGVWSEEFEEALQEEDTIRPVSNTPVPLIYPNDLGVAEDLQYMMRFTIYDTGGTELRRHRQKFTENQQELTRMFQDKAKSESQTTNTSISLAQLLKLAKVSFDTAVDNVLNAFGGDNSGFNVSGAGKGRDSFVEEASGFDKLTEYVQSIYLYIPGQIKVSYKFDYEDADLTSLDILRGLRSLTETQTTTSAAVQSELAKTVGMAALKVADESIELVGGQEIFTNNQAAATREIRNPFVVHLFKGVGRRTFRFEFDLFPRSQTEAVNIEKIIKTFKLYAHPNRSAGGRFLDFPAEFQIEFLYKNAQVIRMPKIMKCALTEISTDYGEKFFTSTIVDSEGKVSPTKIKLQLEFSELELLTRDRIARGA